MNILILTPDAAGGSILQRIITLILYYKDENVSNCREITEGICLKNNRVCKDHSAGYEQTIDSIIDVLKKSKTSLISRLSKYHLDNREEKEDSCKKLYNFLNEYNNIKLVCLRKNIFEYALTWGIREKTSGLGTTYYKKEIKEFDEIKTINIDYFLKKCKDYVEYVKWTNIFFPTHIKVFYEDFVTEPDISIKNLFKIDVDFFKNKFGNSLKEIFKIEYKWVHNLQTNINKEQIKSLIKYRMATELLRKKDITSVSPFKNKTLEDKKRIVKNYDECKKTFYNFAREHNWIDTSNIEYDFWLNKNLDNKVR
jgi:hypothetical protein